MNIAFLILKIFIGFVFTYIFMFITTFFILNCAQMYSKLQDFLEFQEQKLKVRPQNKPKKVNKSKRWNEQLGVWEEVKDD